ncbi:MAG TPA: phosphoadenylyl-sulfate reductase [Polyangiaceae bacterium LLY-WYZ-14_1]|nr:phosphoadenylyl-sulfate reductase [Polyangiaceae bacterium LLY-WYZ-14_1]
MANTTPYVDYSWRPEEAAAGWGAGLAGARPEDVLVQSLARIPGRVAFATGFGVEGCVLIDLISRMGLRVEFFTLDTGFFFPETLALWGTLERRYGCVIRGERPELTVAEQAERHGPALYDRDPDLCCHLRKVLPLARALRPYAAWVTAIRRDQSPDRAGAQEVEVDGKHGLLKVNPLVGWSSDDVWDYVRAHDVPHNPLHHEGYPSIGCAPCTTPVAPGEDPRAGRWRGRDKTECGIHPSHPVVRLSVLPGGRS